MGYEYDDIPFFPLRIVESLGGLLYIPTGVSLEILNQVNSTESLPGKI